MCALHKEFNLAVKQSLPVVRPLYIRGASLLIGGCGFLTLETRKLKPRTFLLEGSGAK